MKDAEHSGKLAWVELATTSIDEAHAFYLTLFGWNHRDNLLPSGQTFCMLSCDDNEFGSIYETGDGPPGWMVYFRVSELDNELTRVRELGGQVLSGPYEIGDAGRMAVCIDPGHAVFSLWEPGSHPGIQKMRKPGLPAWVELTTHHIDRVKDFYCQLFDWDIKITHFPGIGTYLMFTKGPKNVAGGIEFAESDREMPPYWLVYFAVRSIEGTVKTVQAIGGKLILPATDIEGVGRFAMFQDTVGALFACIEFHETSSAHHHPA